MSNQMSQLNGMKPSGAGRRPRALGLLAFPLAAMLVPLGGCISNDSFLNPSVTGRWEHTPTRVPILEHLAAIETPDEEWVEISEITAEDLTPQTTVYRVAPGDILTLSIWDVIATNQVETLPRQVDPNGYVEIPQIGRVFVSGLTEKEVEQRLAESMLNLVADPLVSVVVEQRREQTFYLRGNVSAPGPYVVPSTDFRLLQGLVGAGDIPQFVKEIYVIRQVPLNDSVSTIEQEAQPTPGLPNQFDQQEGEDLLDVIDDLSSPGMMSGAGNGLVAPMAQPGADPLIDLIDPVAPARGSDENNRNSAESGDSSDSPMLTPRWRFVDGQWVRESIPVAARRKIAARNDSMTPSDSRGQLFTQRVVRVPVGPLVAGDARYNIVLRPGDIVSVPPSPIGNVYIDGQVNAPGVYNLPVTGRLTLTRAITSAAGLNGVAIPERVDLTRIVGVNEQATIMLNLRAIQEGTQPDVYIKPDDRINVGTNFWATPLAVLRSGFRTNYGFGFLLDRNFGNDVFGAPPVNRTN